MYNQKEKYSQVCSTKRRESILIYDQKYVLQISYFTEKYASITECKEILYINSIINKLKQPDCLKIKAAKYLKEFVIQE